MYKFKIQKLLYFPYSRKSYVVVFCGLEPQASIVIQANSRTMIHDFGRAALYFYGFSLPLRPKSQLRGLHRMSLRGALASFDSLFEDIRGY